MASGVSKDKGKADPLYVRRGAAKRPKFTGIEQGQPNTSVKNPPARKKDETKLYSVIDLEDNEAFNEWIDGRLVKVAGSNNKIALTDFQKVIGVRQSLFAKRIFDQFESDDKGCVEKSVVKNGLNVLVNSSSKEKLKVLFDVYDLDGNGYLEPDELRTVLNSCMQESSLKLTEEELDRLTYTLIESMGKGETTNITFDEFYAALESRPELMENLNINPAQWLHASEETKSSSVRHIFSTAYWRNRASHILFWLLFTLINIGLFTFSVVKYRNTNWCLMLARGCGMCLNFNSAAILVPMLRYSLTWLRTHKLAANLLPLDHSVLIHKVMGIVIFLQAVVHTLAHLGNLVYVTMPSGNETVISSTSVPQDQDTVTIDPEADTALKYWEYLFTLKGPLGYLIPGFAFLSGDILLVITIIMVICSMPFVRRSGKFEVFFWTHKLYIAYWIFLVLHGPIFWMFFVAPLTIYLLELITHNRFSRRLRLGKTHIIKAKLLPSKVTHLVISRPEGFHYHPGDYIFINIPEITRTEWHPFTISSAPEMSDAVWLHIRTLGLWTDRVFKHFEAMGMERIKTGKGRLGKMGKKNSAAASEMKSRTGSKSNVLARIKRPGTLKAKTCKVEVLLDGPYGTPTRDIFETEHAVLVASGIGVTPFASILQSIMSRYRTAKHCCPNCNHAWYGDVPHTLMKLKKVNFIWINRDQKSFEWFVSLLTRLEMEQGEEGSFDNFLDMQMFMTAATSANDMKGLGLQLAMDVLHEKQKVDLVTGLRTRTQPGRPNWDKVFTDIAANRKGKVKVFFCGHPLVGKTLKKSCNKHGFGFSQETF